MAEPRLIRGSFCQLIQEITDETQSLDEFQRSLVNRNGSKQWKSLMKQDTNAESQQFEALATLIDALLPIFASIDPQVMGHTQNNPDNNETDSKAIVMLTAALQRRCALFRGVVGIEPDEQAEISAYIKAMSEIKDLPSSVLVTIVTDFVDRFAENAGNKRDLDLLLPMMQQLVSFVKVTVEGQTMDGLNASLNFLTRLCDQNWSETSIISSVRAFTCIAIHDGLRSTIIDKLMLEFPNLPVQDTIEFVKGVAKIMDKSSAQAFVRAIIEKFDGSEKNEQINKGDVLKLQSSLFCLLKEEDPEVFEPEIFANAFEAVFKGRSDDVFKPFSLSVGLALCSDQKCAKYDKVWRCLIEQVKTVQDDSNVRQGYGWLRHELQAVHIKLVQLCRDIVANYRDSDSAIGFLFVLQGLNRLAFDLLKTNVKHVQVVNNRLVNFNMSVPFQTCILGRDILMLCASENKYCVSATFQRLIRRVLDSKDKNCLFYIDLLKQLIVQYHVHLHTVHEADILDLVRDMACILPYAARPLIRALMPLAADKAKIRDAIMNALYAAMIETDPQMQKVAAFGILQFLRIVNIFGDKGVLSQTQHSMPSFSSSQQPSFDFSQRTKTRLEKTFEEKCLKSLMCLKRCLHYDYSVRSVVYKGLCQAASKNDDFVGPVFTLLHQQLQQYLTEADVPFAICKVTDSKDVPQIFLEPLGELLMSMTRSMDLLLPRKAQGQSNLQSRIQYLVSHDGHAEHALKQTVIHTVSRLLEAAKTMSTHFGPEDFNWTKDSNFGRGSAEGIRNSYQALCVVSLYDALIDFVWAATWDLEENTNGSLLMDLILTQAKFTDYLQKDKKIKVADGFGAIFLKKAAVNEEGVKVKAEKTATDKTPWQPCVQFSNLKTMMDHILLAENPSKFVLSLKEKCVVQWLGNAIESKIVACQHDSYLDDAKRQDTLMQMLRVMLEFHGDEEVAKGDENRNWLQSDECKVMAAHLVKSCTQTICKLYARDVTTLFKKLKWDENYTPTLSFIRDLLFTDKLSVKNLLLSVRDSNQGLGKLSEREQSQYKQCTYFLNTVSTVVSCLAGDRPEIEHTLAFVREICHKVAIYDVSVCKCLWDVYFSLYIRCEISKRTCFTRKNDRPIYDEELIAKSIANVLNKDDEEDSDEEICKSLTKRACAMHVCVLFFNYVSNALLKLHGIVKGRLFQGLHSLAGVSPNLKQQEQFEILRSDEMKICGELRRLIYAVTQVLTFADLEKKFVSEALMAMMIQHYVTLDEFCKYQKVLLNKFGTKLDIFVSECFFDLVLSKSPKMAFCQIQIVTNDWNGWPMSKGDNQSGRLRRLKTNYESRLASIMPRKNQKKYEEACEMTDYLIEARFNKDTVLMKRGTQNNLEGEGGNLEEENGPKRRRVSLARNALRDAANANNNRDDS